MKDLQTEYIECSCHSPEHTYRYVFMKAKDWRDNEVSVEVYLNTYDRFFKRCWTAIKYVLGYKSSYGHWDNAIMKREDVPKLRQLLQEFEAWDNEGQARDPNPWPVTATNGS
jgi:hypothetical protein